MDTHNIKSCHHMCHIASSGSGQLLTVLELTVQR